MNRLHCAVLVLVAGLAGCVQMPVGPSVAVMPGANKPFDVFVQDDNLCRSWASHSIGEPGHDAAAQQMMASTITGAAIGAIAGGLAGGDRGAGTGAAIGTMAGASVGANQGSGTAWSAQRRYDIAYQQCMYSKGNLLPGTYGNAYRPSTPTLPSPVALTPPPPPPPKP